MSFILDALKKSETERQQQGGAEFTTVPSGTARSRTPRWIWILAVLLLVNIAAMLGLLFRSETPTAASPSTVPEPAAPVVSAPEVVEPAGATSSFEEQVADVRDRRPAVADAAATDFPPPATARQPAPAETGAVTTDFPSMIELLADGSLQIPDLHLDVHVFSHVPSERFVFINMNKQIEGSVLEEGPRVVEITVDGVVLEYRDKSFKLTRD